MGDACTTKIPLCQARFQEKGHFWHMIRNDPFNTGRGCHRVLIVRTGELNSPIVNVTFSLNMVSAIWNGKHDFFRNSIPYTELA